MNNKKISFSRDLLASKEQRFYNFIIDSIIVYIFCLAIGTTIILVGEVTTSYNLTNWVDDTLLIEKIFFVFAIYFLYFYITEMYFSRTFGKYFTKTMVVFRDGSRPKMIAVIVRTLSRFIPFEGISFLGKRNRGIHDLFSDTYVVKKKDFIAQK